MLYPSLHFAYAICSNSMRLVASLPIGHQFIHDKSNEDIIFCVTPSINFKLFLERKDCVIEYKKLEICTKFNSEQCHVFTFKIYLCY